MTSIRLRSTGRSRAANASARCSRDSIGGTRGFYTFRRAVFHDAQRATTTLWALASGCRSRTRRSASSTSAVRVARAQALQRAQGEGRLAPLDLGRPRPRHEPVDEVAGADLQVAPLVDRVAMRVGQDALAALAGVGQQDAVEGGQQAGRGGRLGVRPRRVGQVVERAALLVLEACEVGREALDRLAHRRRAPPDPARHVLGAGRPEGAQVPAHDLIERLVALGRAARARRSAQRAGRLGAPGAVGGRAHEARPALERAPLVLRAGARARPGPARRDEPRPTPRSRRRSPRRSAASWPCRLSSRSSSAGTSGPGSASVRRQ